MECLILDDDQGILSFLSKVIQEYKCNVHPFSDPLGAEEALSLTDFDCAFIDVNLPVMSGLEFAQKFRQKFPDADIVMITGDADYSKAIGAIKIGAFDFIEKPIGLQRIHLCLDNLLYRKKARETEARLRVLEFATSISLQIADELRNKLTPLGGIAKRLAEKRDLPNEKIVEYTRRIQDDVQELEKGVQEILDSIKSATTDEKRMG